MTMSVQLSPSVIHTRPLTPPHDVDCEIESALQFLRDDDIPSHTVPQNTPPNSSPFRSSPSQRLGKRVEFHPVTTFLATPGSRRDERTQRRPKSILKTSSPLPTPDESSKHSYFLYDQPGGVEMLESAVQHLDAVTRDARLDAYLAINGVLSAYDDMPTLEQWKHHLKSIQQHILRDIKLRELHDSVDTNTIIQAIKLAAFMLHDEQIVKLVDLDFQTSVLDRTVAALSDVSKQIMKTSLGLLSQQRLTTTILTASRVEKILTALNDLGNKSKGVITARLMIYRRLADQIPSTMLSKMLDWLPHVLNGMMSDLADTRQRAIDLGMHVAIASGRHAQATEVLHHLLETEDNETIYFEHFTLCLARMLKSKDARLHVPQIWAVIILFHRTRRHPVYNWKRFRAWLLVLQECMNCSDIYVKQQANIAWRKLVYVVQPDSGTPTRVHFLLKEPIRLGFAKVGSDRAAKQSRQYALDSYYNLLHYALRPGLQHNDLDIAWDTFVVELLQPMILASSKGRSIACAVVTGLLTPNTGSWNADAVLEDAAILPQDLPRLDPRWVRTRLSKILKLVEPILAHTVVANEELFLHSWHMWESMLKSVLEAGSQEVKLSTETKTAIAGLLVALRRLWDAPQTPTRIDRLHQVMSLTMKQFDATTMTSTFLSLQKGELLVQPSSAAISPVWYILTLAQNESSLEALRSIIQDYLPTKPDQQRSWLLNAWHSLRRANADTMAAWSILADLSASSWNNEDRCTDLHQLKAALADTRPLLTAGYVEKPAGYVLSAVQGLINAMLSAADTINVDSARLLVSEPIAEDTHTDEQLSWTVVRSLLQNIQWPASAETWSAIASTLNVPTSRLPHHHLTQSLSRLCLHWYTEAAATVDNTATLLSLATSFVGCCPEWCKANTLSLLETGLATWIEDVDSRQRLPDGQREPSAVLHLLQVIFSLFPIVNEDDLQVLDPYLAAAFKSTFPDVVEVAVAFWNNHSESTSGFRLPSALEPIIRSLSGVININLPTGFDAECILVLPYHQHVSVRPTVEAAALDDVPLHSDVVMDGSKNPESPVPLVEDLPTIHRDDASTPEEVQLHDEMAMEGNENGPVIEDLSASQLGQQSLARCRPSSPDFFTSPRQASRASSRPRRDEVENPASTPNKSARLFQGRCDNVDVSTSTPIKPARPRHDDSQADFAPIASTPQADSQLFTTHQLEVRDRQHEDAVRYPALSSSPTVIPRPISLALPSSVHTPTSQLSDSPSKSSPSTRSSRRKRRKRGPAQAERRLRSQHSQPSPDAQLQHEAEVAFRASQVSQSDRSQEPSPSSRKRKRQRLDQATKRAKYDADVDIGDNIVVASGRSKSSPAVSFESPNVGASVVEESFNAAPSPSGLLQRLRNVLKDFQNAIITPSEERSIDDVLFTLRQANFEAGRRGREM